MPTISPDYKILSAADALALERAVNEWLAKGYQCAGGVQVAVIPAKKAGTSSTPIFMQAMTGTKSA